MSLETFTALSERWLTAPANRAACHLGSCCEQETKGRREFASSRKAAPAVQAALDAQLVPNDSELLKMERYREFLKQRREALARCMNAFIRKQAGESQGIGL